MTSPAGVHPRRRAQKGTGSLSPQMMDPPHTMTLRKSGTFSARTGISSDLCRPIENIPFMPKRSPTCPLSLEALIVQEERFASRQEEVEQILKDFDNRLTGACTNDADVSILKEPQVLAVPRFLLDQVIAPASTAQPMELDEVKGADNPHRRRHHDSDSGLGSSIESPQQERRCLSSANSISTTHAAITKSFSSPSSSHLLKGYHLSTSAVNHIEDNIVKPILDEPTLKDFHPLIEDIPRRIGARFISNLRDLEKTLLFLAPDFSTSPASFLKFCETSIECLHTTVDFLSERDQRLPTDRPYTNNYFLDLVEQIRRYAAIMQRTRERQASGEALDEMDFSPDEEVRLEGGLSANGRPAELVRYKDGKSIPLVPEGSRTAEDFNIMSSKRSHEDMDFEDDDDDILRSMARRRKGEQPGDVMQVCKVCRKEFKRPCDLTKHEKTHSRPWKCPDNRCRYHDLGWPTEKERDRHINDKHSSAPKMYKCNYSPCTYSSKRESNCKQHMEKAHGWSYVRSKSNGRKKGNDAASTASPSTPLTPFMATPGSMNQTMATPESNFAQSPWTAPETTFGGYGGAHLTPAPSIEHDFGRRDSGATTGSAITYSSGFSPNNQANLMDAPINFTTPLFGNPSPSLLTLDTAFGLQQPTPALSLGDVNFSPAAVNVTAEMINTSAAQASPHISPHGQGHLTLGTAFDEGFGELGFGGDFPLYDDTVPNGLPTTTPLDSLFDESMNGDNGFGSMAAPFMDTGYTFGQVPFTFDSSSFLPQ